MKLTSDELRILGELVPTLTWAHYLDPALVPYSLRKKFLREDLKGELLHALATSEVGVDLAYWYRAAPPGSAVALERSCGTTACIAGHLVLLLGCVPWLTHNDPRIADLVLLGGEPFRIESLALFIWAVNYPQASLRVFHDGIRRPDGIFEAYEDETQLTLEHLRAFLEVASAPLPTGEEGEAGGAQES